MKKGLLRWGAAVATMALLVGLLAIPAWGQTAEPDLTCPFTQGTIVDLGAHMIRSDLTKADAETGPVAVSIPAGRYDIYLYSYDPHDGTSPQVQAHEQWQLADRSMVSGATPSFLSGIIADLPNDVDFLSQQVNADTLVPDLTELWARHAFWPTPGDAQTYANSIHPVCAAFVPVPEAATGSIKILKNAINGNGTFSFSSETLDDTDFSMTTASGVASTTFDGLPAGIYDVKETVLPPGWELTSTACSDGSDPAQIDLAEGESVTCVFTNTFTASTTTTTTAPTTTTTTAPTTTTTTAPPTTTTTAPQAGTIGDFVWNDANTNGLQDAGEIGIAGATVNLLDGSGAQLESTTTDSDGHYGFSGLLAGDYIVEFVLPAETWEFSAADQGSDDTIDSDAGANGRSGIISLGAGVSDLTVDAGIHRTTEVEPTTAVRPTTETLPFTGASSSGLGGAAVGLVLLGGLVLLAVRGKEDDLVVIRNDAE
ncbi:MAG: hypothetical protein GXP34_00900 [Actinobacteria bacterium]|nr:hypothetical protein [Actinomycetota bacterium]